MPLLILLICKSDHLIKIEIGQVTVQFRQIITVNLMDNFAIHLIHQPESSKVCKNLYGMSTVRCGAECQIHMTEVGIICLLLKFFHAIFVDKQFCFFQRIIRSWLICKVMIMIELLFFSRYFWCGKKRRKCLPSIEHGVSAVLICLHIFQSGFSYLIMPVILGCCFPQWQHHLIDFLYAGWDGQLFIYLLNTFPIVCNGIEFIGARIMFRCIYKKAVNASGKLPDLIACHCFTVLVRKESILRNHYADAFCNAAPFQLHLCIGLRQITMTE